MTTGVRRFAMRISKGFRLSRQMIFPEVSSPNSLISAPATKVRPATMSTTALSVSSFSICATAVAMPAETAELSAFTGGLLIVTTATPSIFVSCTRSLMHSVSLAHRTRISGEWDADFLRNDAEFFDHRHDQRHALLAPQFLRVAFRIAGDERTVGSGRGLRGPIDADGGGDVGRDLIRLYKAVNAGRAEKVADSLPCPGLRHFRARSKKGRFPAALRSAS